MSGINYIPDPQRLVFMQGRRTNRWSLCKVGTNGKLIWLRAKPMYLASAFHVVNFPFNIIFMSFTEGHVTRDLCIHVPRHAAKNRAIPQGYYPVFTINTYVYGNLVVQPGQPTLSYHQRMLSDLRALQLIPAAPRPVYVAAHVLVPVPQYVSQPMMVMPPQGPSTMPISQTPAFHRLRKQSVRRGSTKDRLLRQEETASPPQRQEHAATPPPRQEDTPTPPQRQDDTATPSPLNVPNEGTLDHAQITKLENQEHVIVNALSCLELNEAGPMATSTVKTAGLTCTDSDSPQFIEESKSEDSTPEPIVRVSPGTHEVLKTLISSAISARQYVAFVEEMRTYLEQAANITAQHLHQVMQDLALDFDFCVNAILATKNIHATNSAIGDLILEALFTQLIESPRVHKISIERAEKIYACLPQTCQGKGAQIRAKLGLPAIEDEAPQFDRQFAKLQIDRSQMATPQQEMVAKASLDTAVGFFTDAEIFVNEISRVLAQNQAIAPSLWRHLQQALNQIDLCAACLSHRTLDPYVTTDALYQELFNAFWKLKSDFDPSLHNVAGLRNMLINARLYLSHDPEFGAEVIEFCEAHIKQLQAAIDAEKELQDTERAQLEAEERARQQARAQKNKQDAEAMKEAAARRVEEAKQIEANRQMQEKLSEQNLTAAVQEARDMERETRSAFIKLTVLLAKKDFDSADMNAVLQTLTEYANKESKIFTLQNPRNQNLLMLALDNEHTCQCKEIIGLLIKHTSGQICNKDASKKSVLHFWARHNLAVSAQKIDDNLQIFKDLYAKFSKELPESMRLSRNFNMAKVCDFVQDNDQQSFLTVLLQHRENLPLFEAVVTVMRDTGIANSSFAMGVLIAKKDADNIYTQVERLYGESSDGPQLVACHKALVALQDAYLPLLCSAHNKKYFPAGYDFFGYHDKNNIIRKLLLQVELPFDLSTNSPIPQAHLANSLIANKLELMLETREELNGLASKTENGRCAARVIFGHPLFRTLLGSIWDVLDNPKDTIKLWGNLQLLDTDRAATILEHVIEHVVDYFVMGDYIFAASKHEQHVKVEHQIVKLLAVMTHPYSADQKIQWANRFVIQAVKPFMMRWSNPEQMYIVDLIFQTMTHLTLYRPWVQNQDGNNIAHRVCHKINTALSAYPQGAPALLYGDALFQIKQMLNWLFIKGVEDASIRPQLFEQKNAAGKTPVELISVDVLKRVGKINYTFLEDPLRNAKQIKKEGDVIVEKSLETIFAELFNPPKAQVSRTAAPRSRRPT